MTGNELREAYLRFFAEKKGHLRLPSFSLIPQDDPTLLLIGAGMAPLKPFFTGKMKPPRPRVTTSQRCVRTGDIENVGRTARHQVPPWRPPRFRKVRFSGFFVVHPNDTASSCEVLHLWGGAAPSLASEP